MKLLRMVALLIIVGASAGFGEELTPTSVKPSLSEDWVAAFDRLTVRDVIVVETSYLRSPTALNRETIRFTYVTKIQAAGSVLIVTHRLTTDKASSETVLPADKVVSITGMDARTNTQIEMDRMKQAKEDKRLQEKAEKDDQAQRNAATKAKE